MESKNYSYLRKIDFYDGVNELSYIGKWINIILGLVCSILFIYSFFDKEVDNFIFQQVFYLMAMLNGINTYLYTDVKSEIEKRENEFVKIDNNVLSWNLNGGESKDEINLNTVTNSKFTLSEVTFETPLREKIYSLNYKNIMCTEKRKEFKKIVEELLKNE